MNKFNTLKDILEHYTPEPNTGCWLWNGAIGTHGYGLVSFKLKQYTTHRFFYENLVGDISNLHVLHKCDNRLCVNPDHLFLGTNHDNILDMNRKGRAKGQYQKGRKGLKGKEHPCFGKTISDEHKKRISESNKGKLFSNEHRQRLSENKKKYYETLRNKKSIADLITGDEPLENWV